MNEIIIFFIGALFIIWPILTKKQGSFLEYYLFFCLFYDFVDVFFPSIYSKWFLSQSFLMFLYVPVYTILHFNSIYRIEKFFVVLNILYFLYQFFVPFTYGGVAKSSLITLSTTLSSFSLLYLSYHYYSTRGDIISLFKKISIAIFVSIFTVVLFTIFQIDSNYMVSGGKKAWLNVEQVGGILYFGNLGVRGFFTYIAFFALLIPALIYFKVRSRITNYFLFGILLFMMILSFKRFALATLFIGMLIYFFSNQTNVGFKLRLGLGVISLFFVSQIFFNIDALIVKRFEERGGEKGIGQKAIQQDIRFYEIGYVYNLIKQNPKTLFFGYSEDLTLKIKNQFHEFEKWTIHNQYAQYLMRYGVIGLTIYFTILIFIFLKTRQYFIRLKRIYTDNSIKILWLLFLMFFVSFLFAGMVGGLEKVTIRGLVFLVLGAITGTFHKMLTNSYIQKPS